VERRLLGAGTTVRTTVPVTTPECDAPRRKLFMPPARAFFPPPPPPGEPGDPGILGPDSLAWRLLRERVLLAAGPAALLLQVAHPLVAAGVAAHSDFRTDPLRRLQGTLDAFLTVAFGDTAQVADAARHVGERHRRVHGTLPVSTGAIPAGTPYRAGDPDLGLWVWATLVWTSVEVADGFVGTLPAPEREAYYQEMTRVAQVFRVPDALLPDTYPGLEHYVSEKVRHVLTVGPTAALLADQILKPDPPILPLPARPVPALLAAGVLPARLRRAYGLPWRHRERVAFRAARGACRHAVPLLPARQRFSPHYVVAAERVGSSGNVTASRARGAGSAADGALGA
jgi:uncharacterized protein (DUF2236 family)